MSHPTVDLTREADVATLTFAAGPLNLYSAGLHAAFDEALDQLDAHPARAVVVRAAGKLVSGGVDVAEFAARRTREDTQALYDRMLELPHRIAALGCPTVFVAHGLTLTWALEVALACDLILASRSASFGLVERVIGLTPTMGGTQRLAARAGVGRAKQIVLTGARFDAETFERWNIVNAVYGDSELDAGLDALATDLASGPTRAFAAMKEVLAEFSSATVGAADASVTTIASGLFDTEDLQHGMASFLADGPGRARFEGR